MSKNNNYRFVYTGTTLISDDKVSLFLIYPKQNGFRKIKLITEPVVSGNNQIQKYLRYIIKYEVCLKYFFTKYSLLLLVLCLLIVLIQDNKSDTNEKTVYIFQTSDIHGYLGNNNVNEGGWLRLAYTVDEEIQKIGGRDKCLLIDCGDTFQGSFEAALTKGSFVVKILNMLSYNVFVPGNHDFDYGLNYFVDLITNLNADVLAANLEFSGIESTKIKKWKMYKINNVKIAIIGMTSPYIKHWIIGNINDIEYSIDSLSDTLNGILADIISCKPDIIILAFHHGIYNSKRFEGNDRNLRDIIKKFPEINIILGGHTHQIYSGELVYGNSIFIQPGAHGSFLGKIKITISSVNNSIPKIDAELIPIKFDMPINTNVENILKNSMEYAHAKSKETIGILNSMEGIFGFPDNNSGISGLFALSILNSIDADAVMCSALVSEKTLSTGKVTRKDIFEICPYEDLLITLSLKLDDLRVIMIEQGKFNSKYRDKLKLYAKLNDKMMVINNINELPKAYNEKDRLRVVFSSYDIAGAGNRFPILKKMAEKNKSTLVNTGILLREAVIKYIQNNNE